MNFFLIYWKIIAAGVGTLFIIYSVHYVDSGIYSRKLASAVEAQITFDISQCNQEKQITKETNDALQQDRDTIDAKLVTMQLQQPANCVPVTSKAKLPASKQREHARQDGISSQWLLYYAAECEGYRTEIIACTKFIDDTWKATGQ